MCTSHVSCLPRRKALWSRVVVLPALLCVLALANCGGNSAGLLPGPINDLDLGVSSSEILNKIGSVGKVAKTALPMPGRQAITWTVPVSPYFKRIGFEFTEKDRLYLARFVVKDEVRLDVKTIKQKLFDKYKVSWDEPNRFSRQNMDVLVYAPDEDGKYVVFEITDTVKGEKTLELFSTDISLTDRKEAMIEAKKKQEAASGKKEPGAAGGEKAPGKPETGGAKDQPKPETKTQEGAPPPAETGE
ncbi:MAG: hypothetical protein AB1646_23200 [Thermodesulfobacteriota bacterium]